MERDEDLTSRSQEEASKETEEKLSHGLLCYEKLLGLFTFAI
jgi:hypothetical protein